MKIESFIVHINDGKIEWKSDHHEDLFRKYLRQFADGKYRLEIKKVSNKRSLQQNRYYWLYLTMIAEETGYTKDEVHEWVKGRFLTKGIKEIFGDKTRVRASTADRTKGQFIELLMEIEAVTGIPLPDTSEFLGYSYHY